MGEIRSYHIHIQGLVQGVGFRPFVYQLAQHLGIKGWVNNTTNGVHIELTTDANTLHTFVKKIREKKPAIAEITALNIRSLSARAFDDFQIIDSQEKAAKKLLLAPDFAMCEDCREELFDPDNKRFQYPFLTCTNCGPRYSIIRDLPYDRETTTMEDFPMCPSCREEYQNPMDRRYYSQTNSCPDCAIQLAFYENGQKRSFSGVEAGLRYITQQWSQGKIVAIKGIGGYLLTCDAGQAKAVQLLRQRKHRPVKPFALMYHDLFTLAEDVELDAMAAGELQARHSPIVLLSLKQDRMSTLAVEDIAPGMEQIGVMLPYTPLYTLLMGFYQKPIIATSGNISNATIIYENDQALEQLANIADLIVTNNRKISVPQDDSVVKWSTVKRQRVLIRRSRGLAPAFLDTGQIPWPSQTILCMGAALKSTFTLLHQQIVSVSPYIGNTELLAAQENYQQTLQHLLQLFDATPEHIVVDQHPNYFSRRLGEELSVQWDAKLHQVQHHEAHFWSVLAEYNLLTEEVLGVVWDGTGYGSDAQIWGGEFFVYQAGQMERRAHLPYFNFFLGDKMPREPRISALAILGHHTGLENKFSEEEWRVYRPLLAQNPLKTSSVGRLFDAAASILLDINRQTFEGEAAMQLEQKAYRYFRKYGATTFYTYLEDNEIPEDLPVFLLRRLLEDKNKGYEVDFLAAKFHISLAHYIFNQAKRIGISKVAFSGGVFQNTWLVDLLQMFMAADFELYFQKNLSPNDEGISYGQLRKVCFDLA